MVGLTRIINAGQDDRREHPTYVELDTTTMRFLWRK
jgi:aspartate carbamoyltransferase catalytic subunit